MNNILTNARVMVTGGAGMIGSHIVDELLKEDVKSVTVYDNFSVGTVYNLKHISDNRLIVIEDGGDLRNIDTLENVVKKNDYIFHLACMRIRQCHDYPISSWENNVNGTLNLLSTALRAGIKRIVYSSSASVYGDSIDKGPMPEEHPFNNDNIYGASKIACEQLFRAYCKQYGQDYVGLRYMNVYGPRQDYRGAYTTVIMKVLDRIDQGLSPIIYGNGSQSYDFILAEDVARANILAIKHGSTDNYYNIGTGIKTSIKELVEIIIDVVGTNLPIEFRDNAGITWVSDRVGCTKKSYEQLGFKAKNSIKNGIQKLIKWRNNNKKLMTKIRSI